jgi:hypothetical protein
MDDENLHSSRRSTTDRVDTKGLVIARIMKRAEELTPPE